MSAGVDTPAVLSVARLLDARMRSASMTANEIAELNSGLAHATALVELLRAGNAPGQLLLAFVATLTGRQEALVGFLASVQTALVDAQRSAS